jgi:hypothetical protein
LFYNYEVKVIKNPIFVHLLDIYKRKYFSFSVPSS